MKNSIVLLIFGSVLPLASNAKTFVCVSRPNLEWGQEYVAGTIKSSTTLAGVNFGRRNATNGGANKVYIKSELVEADANYHPIKYKDFNRFGLGSFDDGDGGTSMSVLLPKNISSIQTGFKFDGFLLGQSGSGGGNTSVACYIK